MHISIFFVIHLKLGKCHRVSPSFLSDLPGLWALRLHGPEVGHEAHSWPSPRL